MGTKKGQVRKTARRAYVEKKGKGPRRSITNRILQNLGSMVIFKDSRGDWGKKGVIRQRYWGISKRDHPSKYWFKSASRRKDR